MEGNVKVHVESRTRLPDMEDVLHFRGSGTLERTPSGWQLRYQARSDEDGSLMTSELLWELEQEEQGHITLDYSLHMGQTPVSALTVRLELYQE